MSTSPQALSQRLVAANLDQLLPLHKPSLEGVGLLLDQLRRISGSGRLEEKVNDFFSTRGDLKDAIVSLTQGETMLERLQGLVEDIEDYLKNLKEKGSLGSCLKASIIEDKYNACKQELVQL